MPVDQLNPVDLNLINDLWVPNVFIYNLKTFKVIMSTLKVIIWGNYFKTFKVIMSTFTYTQETCTHIQRVSRI